MIWKDFGRDSIFFSRQVIRLELNLKKSLEFYSHPFRIYFLQESI